MLKILKTIFTYIAIVAGLYLQAQVKSDKYPDLVVETFVSDFFEDRDTLYGGEGLNYPIQMDVNKILGKNPKKWFVSLPKESYVVLQYTDNEIVDVPNKKDIRVVEHGCCQEFASIYVSHDGIAFTYLGNVDDCNNNELDLASISYKESVRFIKVIGLDVKCASPGFDLVSVYGINGANRNLYAGMDEVDTFFKNEKSDKTLILENVYFDTDSFKLNVNEVQDLNVILQKLNKFPNIHVSIGGHTDARASHAYNLNLSIKRANAVKDYLIQQGISSDRIQANGYGETQSLRTNETEEGRAINRRVELRRLN